MTTLVQKKTNTASNQITVSVTAGNGLVIAYFSEGVSTDHITSITDTQGNLWVQAPGCSANGGAPSGSNMWSDVWYCAAALATGSMVVAIHVVSAAGNAATLYELLGTVSFIDGNSLNGTGTNGTPLSITSPSVTSANDALFVAVAGQLNGPFSVLATIPPPWVFDGAFSGVSAADEGPTAHALTSGSLSATFTWPVNWNLATTRNYVASIAAFTAEPPAPPPTTGNIVVSKTTIPRGSPQFFTFTPSWGGQFILADSTSNDSGPLVPGIYSVVETPINGWDTEVSQDPSAIVVDSGATVYVDFTNTNTRPCVPVGGNGVFISDLDLYIGPASALYQNPIPTSDIDEFETTNEGRHAIVLDFNQGAGLYARDLGTVFTWPLDSQMILDVWQPALLPQPEGVYGRATDWMEGGTPGAKFIQGIMVAADSFNAAKTFFLEDSDTLTMHPLNECPATFNGQSEIAFSCTPFVAHSARVISIDGVEWKIFSTRLVFQPWPELCINWQSEMTSLGLTGWGAVREMNIAHVSTADLTLVLTFDAWPTIVLTIPNSGGGQAKVKVTLPANKFKLMAVGISSAQPFRLFRDDLELKVKNWGSMGSYQILKPFGGASRVGATV